MHSALSHARIYESWDGRDQTSPKWDKNYEKTKKLKKGLTSRPKTFPAFLILGDPERDFSTKSITSETVAFFKLKEFQVLSD